MKFRFSAMSVIAACVLLMSGCTDYGKMMKEEPQKYISTASENTMETMVKGNFPEEYAILNEASKNGSFTAEFEVKGIKFRGEGYLNEADSLSSQMYTLSDTAGNSAQVFLSASGDLLKIGTVGASGSHIYSIAADTFEEKLAGSIFAPDSGSEYALAQEDYDMLIGYAAEIDSAIEGDENDAYHDIINNFMESHPPVVQEKTDADVAGETVTANILTYDLTKDDIRLLAEQLTDQAAADGEMEDDEKSDLMSMLDELEDCTMNIVYTVNSKSNMLMKADINADLTQSDEKNAFHIGIVYGADPAASDKQSFAFEYSVDYPEDEEYLEDAEWNIYADVTRGENSSETVISMVDEGETTQLAVITYEKNGDNYTVTANIPEAELTGKMEGTIVTDKDSVTVTIDRLSAVEDAAEISYSPKAVLTIRKGGEMLDLDAEKEFLDITEEELDTLIENISEDFSKVFEESSEPAETEDQAA